MAPKRRDYHEAFGCPPMPHALQVLRDHDVLNGYGVKARYSGPIIYYKAQGLPDDAATKVAEYLVHTDPAERQVLFDKMMAGGATPHNIEKVAAKYQEAINEVHRKNAAKMHRKQPIVMDADGRMH